MEASRSDGNQGPTKSGATSQEAGSQAEFPDDGRPGDDAVFCRGGGTHLEAGGEEHVPGDPAEAEGCEPPGCPVGAGDHAAAAGADRRQQER